MDTNSTVPFWKAGTWQLQSFSTKEVLSDNRMERGPCEDHVKTILKIYETEINRVPEYRDSEEMMEMCDVPWGHRMSPGPPLPCQGAYSGLLDLGQVRGFKLTEVFHTLKVRM